MKCMLEFGYKIWKRREKVYGKVLSFCKGLYLLADASITGKPYKTDIDIVLEGSIYVQAKSGRIVYNGDDETVRKRIEQEWGSLLAKYRAAGASKIICVFGSEVDSRLVNYLQDKGVIVLYGDEWKYPGK